MPIIIALGLLCIIPARGGLNISTLTPSTVYFSTTNMYANHIAVSPVWNFVYECLHLKQIEKKYVFAEDSEAEKMVELIYHSDTVPFPHILRIERPNIVFLLLESFTANVISSLGGVSGVTPTIDSLATEGLLFSNIYASGLRSNRGLTAAISAMPAHPNVTFIKYPDRFEKLPTLPKELKKVGYNTSFYYAGDINFSGFWAYTSLNFDSVVTENNFSGEAVKNRFKWGIHDQYMFEKLFDDMTHARKPFMYMAFNMSSHEPFDVPMETVIKGNDREHRFENSVYYSDSCIGVFIDKCKSSGLWDSTLFVLMADHGSVAVGNLNPSEPKAYHIPLIFTGGALAVKDSVVETVGSQCDMIATLLAQLGLSYNQYEFSKNLLVPSVKPFAFYSYSNAAGIVTNKGNTVYNLQGEEFINKTDSVDENLLKLYLQAVDKAVR